ncbi:MAG: TolB family protein [Anaerolineae bacterium]
MIPIVIAIGLFALLACSWSNAALPEPLTPSIRVPARSDGATRLTTPPSDASDQNPAFSPNGTRLLFTRFENGYNVGPAGLFLLDLSTPSVITRLTPVEDQDNVNLPGAAWSGVNDRIVFASDRAEADDLWLAAPDGSDFRRITTHPGPPCYIEPSWSPDGQWIVFEASQPGIGEDGRSGQIWKVRLDGSGLTQLTGSSSPQAGGIEGGHDDRQPNWSPAGDRILFQRHVPGDDDWNLYTIAPDGSDLHQVTTAPSSDTDASWSPDGSRIVYSSDYGGLPVPNIFIISAWGGTPIRVTRDETHADGAPSWSPDGEWIAFESHQGEDLPASLWRIAVPALNYLPVISNFQPTTPYVVKPTSAPTTPISPSFCRTPGTGGHEYPPTWTAWTASAIGNSEKERRPWRRR